MKSSARELWAKVNTTILESDLYVAPATFCSYSVLLVEINSDKTARLSVEYES
jgi:hypothetical protein